MRRREWFFALIHALVVVLTLVLVPGASAKPKFKVLYNFKGGMDGAGPWAGVTIRQGRIYGTTPGGGGGQCNGGCGTVYTLRKNSGGSWDEKVIHSFDTSADLFGGLVADAIGNLYGTIQTADGSYLFQVTQSGGWNEYLLPDGGSLATLLMDKADNLYGQDGGGVYEVSPYSGGWQQSVLYTFHPTGGKDGTDGYHAVGALIADAEGHLYGATELGGNYSLCGGSGGCGTAFELIRSPRGEWREHVLHRFAQFRNDGQLPYAGLAIDKDGTLYGSTLEGGSHRDGNCIVGCGTVFKLARGTDGHWAETILFDFPNEKNGAYPSSVLIVDKQGNIYGTAGGGTGPCYGGCGVIFKLTRGAGNKWVYSAVHHFRGTDGGMPEAGLTADSRGNLYGTTLWGGRYLYGVVFELAP